MITTEHTELARQLIAERLRAAEHASLVHSNRPASRSKHPSGARRGLASALRRLADRLEPQPRQARAGLSVVR